MSGEQHREKLHVTRYGGDVLWGSDWTKLSVGDIRGNLLTVIDCFSRLLIAYDVASTEKKDQEKRKAYWAEQEKIGQPFIEVHNRHEAGSFAYPS